MQRKGGDGLEQSVSNTIKALSTTRHYFQTPVKSTTISKFENLSFIPKEPVKGAIGPVKTFQDVTKNKKNSLKVKVLSRKSSIKAVDSIQNDDKIQFPNNLAPSCVPGMQVLQTAFTIKFGDH